MSATTLTLALTACGDVVPAASTGSTASAVPPSPAPSPEGASAESGGQATVCPTGAAPEVERSASVYAAMLPKLLEYDLRQRTVDGVFLISRFSTPFTFSDHEQTSTPPPDPAATAAFSAGLRACLDRMRIAGLPAITLVDAYDDPRIPRQPLAAGEPTNMPPRTVDAVVVSVSRVPPSESGFVVSAWADYGGGLDGHGGDFTVHRSAAGWTIVPGLQATA
ncbi:MAG: hypothetical protein ABIM89_07280 [Mycobacteriales bacterium]